MPSVLETRLRRLEETSGDGGGCDLCSGVLIIVSNIVTREFHSATWRGESITEEEASEHYIERECPRCGRKLGERPVIKVGEHRSSSLKQRV